MSQNNCYYCPDFKDDYDLLTSVEEKTLYMEQPVCQICALPYCEKHSSVYNQFSQIDYNCCSNCQDSIENREFKRENKIK